MKEQVLVSFLVISYKHKNFIDDCFESILAQTYAHMEVLYLDDASKDGTFERASNYEERLREKFAKVIFIENASNLGLVKSLNKLVTMCRGEYVKFLAADDFMLYNGVEILVNYMNRHLNHNMVYSNGFVGDEGTHFPIKDINGLQCIYSEKQPSGENLFGSLYIKDYISAPGVMQRRTVYGKIGLYDENIGFEDWDFFLRIAREGSIGYCKQKTVVYRIVENSLSHSTDSARRINMRKSELQILEKYKDIAENSSEKMEYCLNEALRDAFHIDDKEYISYLHSYAKNNEIRISIKNSLKSMLYRFKVIRLFDQLINR